MNPKRAIILANLVAAVCLISRNAAYASCIQPNWFKTDALKDTDKKAVVQCDGTGATADLSELDARDRCDARAGLRFRQKVSVKEIVVTTNADTATHSEVKAETCLDGFECSSSLVSTCEERGVTWTWLRCEYDFSKVHELSVEDCEKRTTRRSPPRSNRGRLDAVENRSSLAELQQKVQVGNAGQYQHGDGYILRVSVVPACDDAIIVGDVSRPLKCKSNPLSIPVRHGDKEIVIRAKGYLPRTIELGTLHGDQHLEVYLDIAD